MAKLRESRHNKCVLPISFFLFQSAVSVTTMNAGDSNNLHSNEDSSPVRVTRSISVNANTLKGSQKTTVPQNQNHISNMLFGKSFTRQVQKKIVFSKPVNFILNE